jgi:hypothetical protein
MTTSRGKQEHTAEEYIRFISEALNNGGCFKITTVGTKNINRPERYCLFSVPSQHVYGNSIEHLIDNAIKSTEIWRDNKWLEKAEVYHNLIREAIVGGLEYTCDKEP